MTTNAVGSVGLLKEVNPLEKKDKKAGGPSFEEALTKEVKKGATTEQKKDELAIEKPILKFSNHALERMSNRKIHFTPEQITKIEQGMQKAMGKGSKETLVLTDDSALIVNLKDKMVVTVMDKSMLKENVFTNIDSTVFV
jgi:flagellar operon protein